MIETGLNDIQPDSSLKTYLGDSIHLLRDAISERKAKSVIGVKHACNTPKIGYGRRQERPANAVAFNASEPMPMQFKK
jgi:hypothetical protein